MSNAIRGQAAAQTGKKKRRGDATRVVPRLRLVVGEDIAIGPGKAQLLALIRDTGSIAAAGRATGMSYKRAWLLVSTMNDCFEAPLVVATRGGNERGGAALTDAGATVLAAYHQLVDGLESSAALRAIRNLITPDRH